MDRIEAILKRIEKRPQQEVRKGRFNYNELSQIWEPGARKLIPMYEPNTGIMEALRIIAMSTKGAIVAGPVGTGKTAFMQILFMLSGLSEEFSSAYGKELISTRMIQTKYSTIGDPLILNLSEVDMLCIDDLGAETPVVNQYGTKTDPVSNLLFLRYEDWQKGSKKITFATTNLNEEALKKRYGDRLSDRMKEMFTFIVLKGTSKRK